MSSAVFADKASEWGAKGAITVGINAEFFPFEYYEGEDSVVVSCWCGFCAVHGYKDTCRNRIEGCCNGKAPNTKIYRAKYFAKWISTYPRTRNC